MQEHYASMASVKMSKRKHKLIGGWGARTELTPRQQAELDTCLKCTLSECVGKCDPACPLHPDHEQYVALIEQVAREVRACYA